MSSVPPRPSEQTSAWERVHAEEPDPLRSPFELDRHRIIESTAFRRLEGKTQVFAPSAGDHFRTRLTHTLEVANVARCLATGLGAQSNLAEAISLAHDLGHPPFGHAGELELDQCMADVGGFNHNTHSLRVVDYLEHPFPSFRGLNLTRAVRDGLRGHSTKYDTPDEESDFTVSCEAAIASLADRIAYDCHDLEDAIGSEFVTFADLESLALWDMGAKAHVPGGHSIHAVRRTVIDGIMNILLQDLVNRRETSPLTFSDQIENALAEFEAFLLERVYRHPEIVRADAQGREMIRLLFDRYMQQPEKMPQRFQARIEEQGIRRVIGDYIAGMTDRFCREQAEEATERRSD